MIYLDNNATTRVADEVISAMRPYYAEAYGNPHSAHSMGRRAHEGVERARADVAKLIGADDSEIVFTSCGTESNALVLLGSLDGASRRKIVTTAVEHPSVLSLLRDLQARGQIALQLVGVDSAGAIDLDAMEAAIDDATLLVSTMLAQNETGVIHPVGRIARMARARGAMVHIDAVQTAGKIAIDVEELGADFLTLSGHKFHAPKGIGILYLRRGRSLPPLWLGGGQEHGLRSGTEAVPLIAGIGAASALARDLLPKQKDVELLRDRFEAAIQGRIQDVSINGGSPRLPNTSSISFHRIPADRIVSALDSRGICVSAGAACHSGTAEPSAVMTAMGKPRHEAIGTVRFSLSRYTTAAEMDEAAGMVVESVAGLRKSTEVAVG